MLFTQGKHAWHIPFLSDVVLLQSDLFGRATGYVYSIFKVMEAVTDEGSLCHIFKVLSRKMEKDST